MGGRTWLGSPLDKGEFSGAPDGSDEFSRRLPARELRFPCSEDRDTADKRYPEPEDSKSSQIRRNFGTAGVVQLYVQVVWVYGILRNFYSDGVFQSIGLYGGRVKGVGGSHGCGGAGGG